MTTPMSDEDWTPPTEQAADRRDELESSFRHLGVPPLVSDDREGGCDLMLRLTTTNKSVLVNVGDDGEVSYFGMSEATDDTIKGTVPYNKRFDHAMRIVSWIRRP